MMTKQKFRIGSSADTADELLRSLELQLLYISGLFSPPPKDAGEAIHAARQTYKKCRALLRLMRDALGYASYYRENVSLREMQRELSRIRDADVQYRLFTRLSENYPEFAEKAWFSGIVNDARKHYDMEMTRFVETGKAADIARHTHSKAAQIQQLEIKGEGFGIIEDGLFRIYRQGREMGTMVFGQEAEAGEIHTFRKKAKYLQFQLSYLRTISKSLLKAMSSSMGQLTDKLGYYNDLQIASQRIRGYAEEQKLGHKKSVALLQNRLSQDMQKALSDSRKIYEIQYAEKPRHFIRRMGSYWEFYNRT